jgi:hypothetical protein
MAKKNRSHAGASNIGKPQGGAVENSLPLLTKAQVAARAACSQRVINYWMLEGLPFVKFSPRMVRFLASDFEAFLRSRRIGGGGK